VRPDWRLALSDPQLALMDTQAGHEPAVGAGLAARLPFNQATAVIENITAHQDMVSVQLYGRPWVLGGSWPAITPCFQVTAVDDSGGQHEGNPGHASASISTHEGTGTFWFWPPVPPQATQLRVTVSTLWEAAWASIDIPGRLPAHSQDGSDPVANERPHRTSNLSHRGRPSVTPVPFDRDGFADLLCSTALNTERLLRWTLP
jgi:hypothetical protein